MSFRADGRGNSSIVGEIRIGRPPIYVNREFYPQSMRNAHFHTSSLMTSRTLAPSALQKSQRPQLKMTLRTMAQEIQQEDGAFAYKEYETGAL
jgi:hypothetical protein